MTIFVGGDTSASGRVGMTLGGNVNIVEDKFHSDFFWASDGDGSSSSIGRMANALASQNVANQIAAARNAGSLAADSAFAGYASAAPNSGGLTAANSYGAGMVLGGTAITMAPFIYNGAAETGAAVAGGGFTAAGALTAGAVGGGFVIVGAAAAGATLVSLPALAPITFGTTFKLPPQPASVMGGGFTPAAPLPTSVNAAKAPGVPAAGDGFFPNKNWDGKKVPSPNGGGYGYPDANGNVWIPTGAGPSVHGGPHWDVQFPGGGYKNVPPGGGKIGGGG